MCVTSSKASTRRACTGERIVLMFILEFVRGKIERERVTVLVLCELWVLIVLTYGKCRTPESLVAGLMWLGVKDEMYGMRHFCENSDDLSSFGWREHNGRDFGRQELVENDMILETSFVKSKGDGSSGYGGDWSVRIDVKNKG